MSDDPNMPKWATDPLLSESTPLQSSRSGEGHGAIKHGNDDADTDGDYDSDVSEEDGGRYSGVGGVRRGCLLNTFLVLNAITVIAALGVGAAQVLVIIFLWDDGLSPESIAIRCYTTFFCILIIFGELEWTQTVREMFVLHAWIPRGILYSFVGMLTLEEMDEKGLDLGTYTFYITVVAWIMVGIGALYFIMGLLCLKRLRDKKQARHNTLVAHAEMQEALRKDPNADV